MPRRKRCAAATAGNAALAQRSLRQQRSVAQVLVSRSRSVTGSTCARCEQRPSAGSPAHAREILLGGEQGEAVVLGRASISSAASSAVKR